MVNKLTTDVLVFLLDDVVSPTLRQTITRHHWPVIRIEKAHQALRQVHLSRPYSVVIQIPRGALLDEALALIGLLRRRVSEVWLVAVAPSHQHELEAIIRRAGVSAYLSSDDSLQRMEQIVMAVQEHAQTADVPGPSPQISPTRVP